MSSILLLPQLLTIAIVQGLTEFLPVSSSGHLVLIPHVTGWQDLGLAYDVAAHFGTLVAVVTYFRVDVSNMTRASLATLRGAAPTAESRLARAVLWATLPVCVIGLLLHDFIATHLRDPLIIAAATIVFALVLWLADLSARRTRDTTTLNWIDVAVIGFAQALALIPGTSRSGITISAGLALGLTRSAAARFSFLLSIPVIALATLYEAWGLLHATVAIDWLSMLVVIAGACISAFACIAVFLSTLERIGLFPFVVYRLFLGAVLIFVFL